MQIYVDILKYCIILYYFVDFQILFGEQNIQHFITDYMINSRFTILTLWIF
jgi:hypothetical protein